MTEIKRSADSRAGQAQSGSVDGASSALHQELEGSAKAVGEHLKHGTPQEMNAALVEFSHEILKLEQHGGKDVAANEQAYLRALEQQNDSLKALGFPGFHLNQDGQKLTINAEIKEKSGAVDTRSYSFDWTSYTKQHQRQGKHEITSADLLETMALKLDPGASDQQPQPQETARPAQSNQPLKGNVKDDQINTGTGDASYPAPQMIHGGAEQTQPHFMYSGNMQVPGDNISVTAHDTNLPGRPQWLDVTGSNVYHSAYGYFDQDRNGNEHFHMLQVSRNDAQHAPGRPVTVPTQGRQWDLVLNKTQE